MSKYNIEEIVLRPIIDYAYTKSKLDTPSVFCVLLNKLSNTNKIIDELNSVCRIKYAVTSHDDCIVFKPKFRRQIVREKPRPKIRYANSYVKKLLFDLGFDTYTYAHDEMATIYVSLRNPKNHKRLQQLGNVFKFEGFVSPLTQSAFDSIKQHKR